MSEKLAPIAVPHGAPMKHARTMRVEIDRDTLSTRAEVEGGESDTIPIALSSEHPVERYDWWEGERYNEILDHAPEAIDMSRASAGLPFLDSHNHFDGRAQMGRILNLRVEDGRLRGDVKFSRRQEAQDYKRDMLDGIRTDISVGYQIDPNNIEISQKDGELKTVRVKRWTPLEASGVSVPADPTVGVGRSAPELAELSPESVAKIAAALRSTIPTTAPQAKESPVPDNNTATPTNGAAPAVTATRDHDAEREMKDVAEVAKANEMGDVFAKGMAEGKSPAQIRNDMIAELRERVNRGAKAVANPVQHVVDLTEREERSYSYARALAAAVDGEDCLEMEVSRAIAAKVGGNTKSTGRGMRLFLPTTIRSMPATFSGVQFRAGLDSGTSTKGTELKYVQAGSFVEMLRNKARVLQLGATYLSGLDGPVTFPKQTGAGTFSWMGENPGAAVTVSEATLGTISLSAKTGMSATKFSRQLLRQAVVDVENLVRSDLATIHALGIDQAAINGSGVSNQPTGILTNTSIGVVALGTNGGTPTFTDTVKLESTVETANANTGPMGYLATPGIKGTLKTTQVFASTNGVPVWLGGEEGEVNGYRAYSSNQVPKNLTKGTSTTVCHAILFGAFQNVMIGEWGAMEVLIDPYTLAGYGMIAVTSFQMLDVALRYPESFAAIKDALPASGF